MKSSLAKKTSITLPEQLEEELRAQAEAEKRTLSGIVQEAARFYLNIKKWEALQHELVPKARKMGIRSEEDVNRLVHGLRK
ncbi:MAG: ribbon-helix-helix protein, CopG family [bacterium]